MLKSDQRNVYRIRLEEIIKNAEAKTVPQVLDILYGDRDSDYTSGFVVKYKYMPSPKTTFWNRFNSYWVYPLFFVTIPLRYLVFGKYTISPDSKMGKIIITLTGDLK